MSPARTRAPSLALALSAVAIVSCQSDLSTAGVGPGDEITRDIGITVRNEVEAVVSALTLPARREAPL
jgi:hypothetical protein